MSGTLHHGTAYSRNTYTGIDECEHFELRPDHGDTEGVCASTWRELKEHCARYGVPQVVWPEFDNSIDLSLLDVKAKNAELLAILDTLPASIIRSHEMLNRIWSWMNRGELVYYTREI